MNPFPVDDLISISTSCFDHGPNGTNVEVEVTASKLLQDLDSFCKMLEFGKFNGKWDVKIDGLGCKYYVSEVEKTAT